jgi:hypothetical protein
MRRFMDEEPAGLCGQLMRLMPEWLSTGELPPYADFGMPDSFDRDPGGTVREFKVRKEFINTYGFAIPCREAMEACARNAPLLEVGAGSGYWTRILRAQRVDVIATDPAQGHKHMIQHARYDATMELLQAKTAIRHWPDRNVLMIWPGYRETWSAQALKAMRIGRVLLTVTEGEGGCCGSDLFFAILETCFEPIEACPLPVFYGLHDSLRVYVKKRAYRRDRLEGMEIDTRDNDEAMADARRVMEEVRRGIDWQKDDQIPF